MGSASESNEARITKPRYKDCINQKPKQQACLNKMDISSRLFGPQVNLIWRQACLSVRSLGNTFVVAGYIYILYVTRVWLPHYAIYNHLVTSTITDEL